MELQIIKKENILGKDFVIYGDIENPLFLAKDVANWIEYDSNKVGQMLKNVDNDEFKTSPIYYSGQVRNMYFLTEYGLYEVLMQSRKPIAKEFKKMVKEVLRDLRRSGCVITESATEDSIDYQSKYGTRRIRKTFNNSEDARKTYEEYLELSKIEYRAKRINSEDRIKGAKIIIDTLEQKIADNISIMRGSEVLATQELLTDIHKDLRKLSNKRNGGRLAVKTKEIKQLEDEMNYSTEDYYLINRHGYTCNRMTVWNSQLKKEVSSSGYRKWKENLHLSDFLPKVYPNVDFTKDLKVTLLFSYKKEFDLDNLVKTIIDQLQEFYDFNDNLIKEIRSKCLENVDSYEDGRIYVRIENIE